VTGSVTGPAEVTPGTSAAAPPTAVPAVRLAALDVDGTILDHDGKLSERVRQAVLRLAGAGVHVVVSTGRSVRATTPVLERLGLRDGWAVCSNGAVTVRLDPGLPGGFEATETIRFDPGPALRLLREHLPDARYAVEEIGVGYRLTAPFPDGELDGTQLVVPFEELQHAPATRVIVRSTEHSAEDFRDLVAGLGLHQVTYYVGWTAWLDIAPDGVTKASALEPLRRQLGVPAGATLAVGDGSNDIEMFTWAARSVAMGQSSADVRAAAGEVAPSVEEDGLAAVLDGLFTD
jgi:hydroxymethylpyrimidine pyrophosphatase-like HAD family hydrolase